MLLLELGHLELGFHKVVDGLLFLLYRFSEPIVKVINFSLLFIQRLVFGEVRLHEIGLSALLSFLEVKFQGRFLLVFLSFQLLLRGF